MKYFACIVILLTFFASGIRAAEQTSQQQTRFTAADFGYEFGLGLLGCTIGTGLGVGAAYLLSEPTKSGGHPNIPASIFLIPIGYFVGTAWGVYHAGQSKYDSSALGTFLFGVLGTLLVIPVGVYTKDVYATLISAPILTTLGSMAGYHLFATQKTQVSFKFSISPAIGLQAANQQLELRASVAFSYPF
jgi:hypothetical protein